MAATGTSAKLGLLARNRRAFDADTRGSDRRQYFSPVSYCQFRITLPLVQRHARGDLMDLGAGDVPHRGRIEPHVDVYHTADREHRADEVDFEVDAQALSSVIPADRYDTLLLLEVLEHVPDPHAVARQVLRVLRPEGRLILSVPHLSRLHEEPHDYYRYTKHGLRVVLEGAGFQDVEIVPRGGLFCFLGHQVSTALVCLTWHLPVVRWIAFFLNKWLVVKPAYGLDRITDSRKVFALGYVAVGRKGASPDRRPC